MKTVKIYTTPVCGFCHMAKRYFQANGISYTEIDVSEDRDAAQEVVNKTGQLAVPVIEIDDEIVIGFDQPRLAKLLGV
ncbi:MAG: glutaredoxin-like protein YruB-family [Candidatus Saccharibacteria bacterium]|nr:glutaredoxin-like protein YruB-family [Candidatus Saccharibacteria bacterium]